MGAKKTFQGFVRRASASGGQLSAQIHVLEDSLRAEAADAQVFEVPFSDMEIELKDGALCCSDAARTVVIHSQERGFIFALTSRAGAHIQAKMAPVRGQLREQILKRISAGLAIGALLAALFWGLPPAVRWALSSAITRIPYTFDEQLGTAALASMDLQGTPVTDPAVNSAVALIVGRLAAHTNAPGTHFQTRLVHNDTVNAFSLPGGNLIVFTGLLKRAANADQVAGVLAHEMAHVTLRHSVQRIGHALGISASMHFLLSDVAGVLYLSKHLFTVAEINKYSAADEEQADALATRIVHDAGLDPQALPAFIKLTQTDPPQISTWIAADSDRDTRIKQINETLHDLPPSARQPLAIDWSTIKRHLDVL